MTTPLEPDVSRGEVVPSGTGLPAREPDETCEGCGAVGTVGRAVRTDGSWHALEIHRFCLTCWPEQSARYRARWRGEDHRAMDAFFRNHATVPEAAARGMTFEAATWHATRELVREIERACSPPVAPNPADLAVLAAEIRRQAPEIEGDMPFEVEMFVRKYRTTYG